MNFIVGFCLIINGGIEEEAFWFFVSLAKSEKYLLVGLYENYFPLIDLSKFIFNEKFKKIIPKLYKHL